MKILIISDLHYEMRIFRGVDESRAWSWLLEIVDYHKPRYVLSCGDWGIALSTHNLYDLLDRATVLSIYGNHENIEVLRSARNRRERYPVLMKDGRVYEINGLRIAGINGVISDRKRSTREGAPFKRPEEYLSVAYSLKGRDIDILLIHEAPYMPDLFPSIKRTDSSITTLEAIKIVEPKLVIGGHVHMECMDSYRVAPSTLYVCLDSSQLNRHYLILTKEDSNVHVERWMDRDLIMRVADISIKT